MGDFCIYEKLSSLAKSSRSHFFQLYDRIVPQSEMAALVREREEKNYVYPCIISTLVKVKTRDSSSSYYKVI